MDPIEDLKIGDEEFKKLVLKIEKLEHRMYTHKLHNDPERDSLLALAERKSQVGSGPR